MANGDPASSPAGADQRAAARTGSDVSVVVITRNRRDDLLVNVPRLLALPERPPIIVVDNDSTDGSSDAVRNRFAEVHVEPLDRNAGAAGRNVGVALATTPYVAFADDDSWWQPGALAQR